MRLESRDEKSRRVGRPLAKPEPQKAGDIAAMELMPMPNAFRPIGLLPAVPAQGETDEGIDILGLNAFDTRSSRSQEFQKGAHM
jgi:hypothetical protein